MKLKMQLSMIVLTLSLTGCATTTKLANTERLLAHPQFEEAVIAAPEFTREALKTINYLEYQLERN
jgi:uncharacterized lipoprotein YmbA